MSVSYNAISLISAPSKLPVTLSEAKEHLRIDTTVTADDALIMSLIRSATQHAELRLSRRLISQTWDTTYDCFPGLSRPLVLPYPPIQSITSITYIDTDGNAQTWAASKYDAALNSLPAYVEPAYSEVYPTTRSISEAVTIRMVHGYGDDLHDVPQNIRTGILFLVQHWYDNREIVQHGQVTRVPGNVEWLLEPYRCWGFD